MKLLVFIHGWGTTGSIWRRQVEAWQGRLTVLTPTLPAWEAGWLAGFLGGLRLETTLVGWSLGGMLLLETLAVAGLTPGGLMLAATPASFSRRPDHPGASPRRWSGPCAGPWRQTRHGCCLILPAVVSLPGRRMLCLARRPCLPSGRPRAPGGRPGLSADP